MLSPVQEKLLEMLKWFHEYCKENHLQYYVVGGTMLGAVRHGGFIPWDDDVDIVLPRPDYERLLSELQGKKGKYLLETFALGNKDYFYAYAKLYDTGTTFTEKARRICRRGIYIDIFPLDGVGATEAERDKNFKRFDRINMFLMTRTCAIMRRRGLAKNIAIVISRMIPSFLLDDHKLLRKVDAVAASFGYEDSKYVGNLMGVYRKKEIMEKKIFGQPTEYPFEDIVVNGVERYEEFLTNLYGDWRQLPPEEKRVSLHDYLELDLKRSWMDV